MTPKDETEASGRLGSSRSIRRAERRIVVGTRFLTLIAVLGSLAGSVLMFFLGSVKVVAAFVDVFRGPSEEDGDLGFGATAIIQIIESLDRFLIAIVLLYFAYGVYSLFIHPEERDEQFALPAWLRVRQIGQLKQVVAELIVVILFVLFLRLALESYSNAETEMSWNAIATLLLLPFSAVLLGIALKLVELHPKSSASRSRSDKILSQIDNE